MYHNAIRNNPDPSGDQGNEYTATCPFCHRTLNEQVYVGPTGELIGCEDCAVERGLVGEPISLEEWFEPEGLHDVLRQFGLEAPQIRKPTPTPTQQPRAHYWEATAEGTRYFLKRFYSGVPVSLFYMRTDSSNHSRSLFSFALCELIFLAVFTLSTSDGS